MSEPIHLREILLPAAIVLVIFLIALFLPPLGVIVGVFSPAPLIIISLKRGKQAGLITTGLVFIGLLIVTGIQQAFFFFAEYAVLAIIMTELLHLRLPFDKCILFSVLGSAVLSGFLLFLVFVEKDVSLTEFLQKQVETHLEQSFEALKTVEQDEVDLSTREQFIEKTSRLFAISYPAIIVVGSLIGALVNYSLARWVMQRFYGDINFFSSNFSVWALPDFFIWLFIFSAGSLFFPEGGMRDLGLNLFVISAVIYVLQGMAIVVHILEKKSVPVFLWVIVFILIFSQPLLIGILLGLGLFDLWLDFRKLRVQSIVED